MDAITHQQWDLIALLASIIFGLVVGSFINVVIYRIPEGLSLISPSSSCPSCDKEIKAYDNIPVLSYVFLRGKCRNCKASISIKYPIVELLTAFVWFMTVLSMGREISTLGYLFFFSGLIALSGIDIKTKLLPKKLVYISGLVLLAFLILDSVINQNYRPLIDAFIVGAIYSGFLFSLWFFSNGKAMGFGDVRLALFLGIAMGYYGYVVSYAGLMVSVFLGSIVGILVAAISGGGRKMKIPFGPFLAIGTIIVLWCVPWIQDLVDSYYV